MAEKKSKSSSSKKKKQASRNSRRRQALEQACIELLNATVEKIEYPGGRNRESLLMLLANGESVIATRRGKAERAENEVRILRALQKHDAPAPALIATDGDRILLQETLTGRRLSLELKDAKDVEAERLLASALTGLHYAQRAASKEELEGYLPALGASTRWRKGFIRRPEVLGEYLGVEAPKLPEDKLVKLLAVKDAKFVKWDSRPGNAQVDEYGQVAWFDWEHAGKRNRLDDMAWLLCDEFVPDYPAVEERLITQFLPQFETRLTDAQARDYLFTYGTFHMAVRLGLILKYKKEEWWDLDYCIDRDKVGITLECAQRVCNRGKRWAGQTQHAAKLAPWFSKAKRKIEKL